MGKIWSSRKTKLIIWSMILVLFAAPMGQAYAQDGGLSEEEAQNFDRYWEIYYYLKEYHVSAPSSDQLTEWAIYGMLYSLDDPYTYYMTEEEFQELLESINGEFVGVGMVLTYTEQGVMIEELIPGGPAAKAGLREGDLLTHVNGEALEDVLLLDDVMVLIAGAEGTRVSLTVERYKNLKKTSQTYSLKREKIELPLVQATMLDDKVGYLKLRSFGDEASSEMKKRIAQLEKLGMEQLILDLRGNSGGFMDAVADVAKLFQERGVLLYHKDNTGRLKPYSITGGKNFNKPLVVLIDEGTASAAEVLAGFLQDGKLGQLVGEESFGKGTIQSLVELESGGILRITMEEYFTPKKNQVNIYGIAPDHLVPNRNFQLAKAYGLLAGKEELQISQNGTLLLNGLDAPGLLNATYQEDGKMYLSIKTLAEWYNGEVDWDDKNKAVVLTLEGKKVSLPHTHSAVKLVQSSSFIDVEQLSDVLPLKVEKNKGTYVIKKK